MSSGAPRMLRLAGFWSLAVVLTASYSLLLPVLILPRRWCLAIVRSYLFLILEALRATAGLTWEVRGLDGAAGGAVLVACKHQSVLETLLLQYVLDDPAIITKQEQLSVPLVGWVQRRLGHIGADRSGDLEAARRLAMSARRASAAGRPVVIFPEGSRRVPGAPPDYKPGVDLLYGILKVPCIPVAVNAGLLWPARALFPARGHVVLEFLPGIPPGLPRAQFKTLLISTIEAASNRLAAEFEDGRAKSCKLL